MKWNDITIGHVLFAFHLALLVGLPIVFRRKYVIRLLCVLFLLGEALMLLHGGLRLAARNADMPSLDIGRSEAIYGKAWRDGTLATQKMVDSYLVLLAILFSILALLALVGTGRPHRLEGNRNAGADTYET